MKNWLMDCNESPVTSKRKDGALKATPAADAAPPPAWCWGSFHLSSKFCSYQTPQTKILNALMDLYCNGDVKVDKSGTSFRLADDVTRGSCQNTTTQYHCSSAPTIWLLLYRIVRYLVLKYAQLCVCTYRVAPLSLAIQWTKLVLLQGTRLSCHKM